MRGFPDDRVRFAVSRTQVEMAKDQEFLNIAGTQLMDAMFSREREFDVRLEGVSDELLLPCELDRLGNNRACVKESLHVFEGSGINL